MGPQRGLLWIQKLVVDFRTETQPDFTFNFRIIVSWLLANTLVSPTVLTLREDVWAVNPLAVLKKVLS